MSDRPFEKKKSLGQHFLTSDIVPQWMCDAAAITSGDTVVEVGPGTGVLTHELLSRGAMVIALEADQRAIAVLEETFAAEIANNQLHLVHCDVRELDLATIDVVAGEYKVVANIPYYLSGRLFRTFLDTDIQPAQLVFLVQKEVAYRIARDRKSSLLSLAVRAFGTPQYVRTVSRGHFSPSPHVDSAIISVTDISQDHFTTIDRATFFRYLHIGFSAKRKQLVGIFAKHFDRETLLMRCAELGLAPDVRAEDLSLSTWLKLTTRLEQAGGLAPDAADHV